ncbi:OmpA family protein [Rhodobacteraceae bacterium D3-12]|nr:OmpA family protein [Rhodobacteraceae bacterium D3-12]
MRNSVVLALAGALHFIAAPAIAQDDMSVEDIRNAFERQLQAFTSVKTRGLGGGQDRGLKLITVDDIKTDARGQQVVVTATSPTAPTTPTPTDTSPTATTTTSVAKVQVPTKPTAPTADTGATVTTTVPVSQPKPVSNTPQVTKASTSDPVVYGQFKPELQVNLHIEFGFDSAALDSSQTPKLEKMCIVLQTSPINKIRIVGHTDTKGTDEYNERLSILRAREVARHLTEECGISAERLETLGLGERFPVNANNPQADENRRVEFQALS